MKCLKSGGRGRRKKSTEQGTDLAKTYKGCPGTVVTDMTVCVALGSEFKKFTMG